LEPSSKGQFSPLLPLSHYLYDRPTSRAHIENVSISGISLDMPAK
jgi:hypothetical protein